MISATATVEGDQARANGCQVLDLARLMGTATVSRGVLMRGWATVRGAAVLDGQIAVTGFATVGGTTEVYHDDVQFHADALVLDNDDWFMSRPPGDQHVWTVHRCVDGGWKANAGCVWGVDLAGPWDARLHGPARLRAVRQEHYAWLQDQVAER